MQRSLLTQFIARHESLKSRDIFLSNSHLGLALSRREHKKWVVSVTLNPNGKACQRQINSRTGENMIHSFDY